MVIFALFSSQKNMNRMSVLSQKSENMKSSNKGKIFVVLEINGTRVVS